MISPEATLTGLLGAHARAQPDAPALIYGTESISYRALEAESRRLARGLRELGVVAGDRVALWLPNTPAWVAALFACARLGAIAVATNTRFRSAEMAHLLQHTAPKVLLLWPDFRHIDFLSILDEIPAESLRSLTTLVAYGEAGSPPLPQELRAIPIRAYRDVIAGPELDDDDAAADTGCVTFNTSGTTSRPKFVLHHQQSIVVHAYDVARDFRYLEPGTVVLGMLPFCGVFGFVSLTAALAAGAPVIIRAAFDAREALELIEQHRVTSMNLTGDMVAQMIPLAGDRAFATVRFCGSGTGAPQYSGPAAEKGLVITGLYGSSEVQALFSRQGENTPLPERAQGGGRPVSAAAEVRATHPQTGGVLPHGEHGMLEFRAPSLLMGYFRDEAATAAAFTSDGYFKSGDLGYTLADGRFVYLARMGDVLRLSGFLVSPVQIEEVVCECRSVTACQVVGVDMSEGVRPVAFVLLAPGETLDEAAILAHCRSRMARYKVPSRVFALERFPTTPSPNGFKVRKEELRAVARKLCAGARDAERQSMENLQ